MDDSRIEDTLDEVSKEFRKGTRNPEAGLDVDDLTPTLSNIREFPNI